MFKSGDLVVFKHGDMQIFEIAEHSTDYGCDLWNEDEFLLNVDAAQIRLATTTEKHLANLM